MGHVSSAEISLEPNPTSVGRARRWLSEKLEDWGLEDIDHDMSVVASELVTNGVLHARTDLLLRLSYDGTLRLEVCDGSPAMPAPRAHAKSSTTGRGLQLVAALSTGWGYEETPFGKIVWAEFSDARRRAGAPSTESRADAGKISRLEHARTFSHSSRLLKRAEG